jgi:rare lipoprotein A
MAVRLITGIKLPALLLLVQPFLVVTILSGCATVPYKTDPKLIGYEEQGIASFYSLKYQFRKTSSGERFNQLALTAAHRTLPFGTKVRVTNLENNRSIIVKINDRGPFIDGRIIDLTRNAFSQIGDTEQGLIKVSIEVIY